MGAFPRACHEPLLVCSRGALPWTGPRNVRSVQRWGQPRLDGNGGKWHSQKPPAVYGFLEEASPRPPRHPLLRHGLTDADGAVARWVARVTGNNIALAALSEGGEG